MRNERKNVIRDITKECYIAFDMPYYAIMYKGIRLWSTIATNLDEYQIYLYDGPNYHPDDPYCLVCLDNLGDMFHYGRWINKSAALVWLEDPENNLAYEEVFSESDKRLLEMMGKIPLAFIDNLKVFKEKLSEQGYDSYLNEEKDHLIIKKKE